MNYFLSKHFSTGNIINLLEKEKLLQDKNIILQGKNVFLLEKMILQLDKYIVAFKEYDMYECCSFNADKIK